jgi:hypothetical protein
MADAGITLEAAKTRLQEYLDAERKVLAGQDIHFEGRRITRADLTAVRSGIEYWNNWIQRLSGGTTRARGRTRHGVIGRRR